MYSHFMRILGISVALACMFIMTSNLSPLNDVTAGGRASSSVDSISYSHNLVQRLQRKLTELNYNPGPVDGIWGPKTRNALMKYQEENNLAITGKIDSEIKKHLLNRR